MLKESYYDSGINTKSSLTHYHSNARKTIGIVVGAFSQTT